MRALLSSVGTRGDVQPVVALALKVRDLGHEVRLCVPPNFIEWVRGLGFEALPVGVEMRHPVRSGGGSAAPLTTEQIRGEPDDRAAGGHRIRNRRSFSKLRETTPSGWRNGCRSATREPLVARSILSLPRWIPRP